MTQTWTTDCFDLDDAGHLDLTNIEVNFASLRSSFSGTSAPSNPVTGMLWLATSQAQLRIRNGGNDGWLGVLHGTLNQLCVFYRNGAEEGWVVSITNTDRVVGIRSGSTYVTGGTIAGSWNISGLTAMAHIHTSYHAHLVNQTEESGWHQHAVIEGTNCSGPGLVPCFHESQHGHTSSTDFTPTLGADNTIVISDASWRPAACVNTVQYMNI